MSDDLGILHPSVREALAAAGAQYEAVRCEPELADTAEFCAHYGIAQSEACNTILVALKKTPREYIACLVRADTRLDVNHRVAAEVSFKRLSFASADETAELTGMSIGGVTLVGLPAHMPILIDDAVFENATVIVGGGNRSSKVRIDPRELLKLPNARRASIAVPRV